MLIFKDIWSFCLDTLKWDTKKIVCNKDYLNETDLLSSIHLDQLKEHFVKKYPAKYEAFSFLLESEEARVAHSADIGSLADLDPLLSQPVDLLACELAHVEPKELFTYLAGKEIRQVAFMHLSRPYRRKIDELKTQAKSILGNLPHTFLNDGDLIEVWT